MVSSVVEVKRTKLRVRIVQNSKELSDDVMSLQLILYSIAARIIDKCQWHDIMIVSLLIPRPPLGMVYMRMRRLYA